MAEINEPAAPPCPPRPNMKNLFTSGRLSSSNKNSKQALMLQSLQWRQAYQNCDHYRYEFESTFVANSSTAVNIQLQQILNGEMKGLGTGTFVWPAAHIMSKYLEHAYGGQKLNGKYLCDIGTGTGLTGFVAAFLGADVVLTDQSCVLELLRNNTNAFLQGVSDQVPGHSLGSLTIEEYDWERKNTFHSKPFDYILVSDCVLPKLYPIDLLVGAVDHLMGENTIALFSYEHRPYALFDPRQEFQRLCKLHGMSVNIVPLCEHHPVYRAEDIELWEVRRMILDPQQENIVNDGRSKVLLYNWGEDKDVVEGSLITIDMNNDSSQTVIPLRISQSKVSGSVIGSFLWPSSVLASQLLLTNHYFDNIIFSRQQDTRSLCLDIGAGCGLTSIVAHHIGLEVLATDRLPLVTGLLNQNLQEYLSHAKSKSSLSCRELDWESTSPSSWIDQLQLSQADKISSIICSDCLYSSPAVQPLLSLLDNIVIREARREDAEKEASIQILLVNELRSALEEFLYFALHRPSPNISVKIQEIPIAAPDLVIVRSAEAFHVSPPLRACLLTWTCSF